MKSVLLAVRAFLLSCHYISGLCVKLVSLSPVYTSFLPSSVSYQARQNKHASTLRGAEQFQGLIHNNEGKQNLMNIFSERENKIRVFF